MDQVAILIKLSRTVQYCSTIKEVNIRKVTSSVHARDESIFKHPAMALGFQWKKMECVGTG